MRRGAGPLALQCPLAATACTPGLAAPLKLWLQLPTTNHARVHGATCHAPSERSGATCCRARAAAVCLPARLPFLPALLRRGIQASVDPRAPSHLHGTILEPSRFYDDGRFEAETYRPLVGLSLRQRANDGALSRSRQRRHRRATGMHSPPLFLAGKLLRDAAASGSSSTATQTHTARTGRCRPGRANRLPRQPSPASAATSAYQSRGGGFLSGLHAADTALVAHEGGAACTLARCHRTCECRGCPVNAMPECRIRSPGSNRNRLRHRQKVYGCREEPG
ncbi:uncharacterized protein PSFLO_07127 [Pseudozyma flocculosa]|uniref:Uncharacterized protein n=1 Tax=Pseudozyma flocculosa TaxID=84751 RepID=A0A5C3FD89_9BASI|nr:uncharacterized protein PSFLO_07127 [Pseudozyma flocculosa]